MLNPIRQRKPAHGRVPGTDNSSVLTGSTGISTEKDLPSGNKDLNSYPVTNVKDFTNGKVSFSDTVLTDRASANTKAEAPAGSTDKESTWQDTAVETAQAAAGRISDTAHVVGDKISEAAHLAADKITSVLPASLTGKDAEQQQAQNNGPSAGDLAKGWGTEDGGMFLNEEMLLSRSTFPIPSERLVEMAKDVLRKGVHKCDKLSADFSFTAPFIGPLNRDDFAQTMETLSLDEVFPDMAPRIYHIRVDPLQHNRVWFTTRPIGTNTGYLKAKLPIPQAPTGKVVELPPQTSSLTFNDRGEVEDFTMGYVMDRRLGNSGGLGGAFGFFWAVSCPLPYPEGKPWSSSWQQRVS
eukprot:GHUV01013153.1.p1 GENE.GHUV01013153.1~~GHUV01013153.1.p1  ORF type:complete len:352 (+),score=80.90 GHUV01013153.1:233-1288(+)